MNMTLNYSLNAPTKNIVWGCFFVFEKENGITVAQFKWHAGEQPLVLNDDTAESCTVE